MNIRSAKQKGRRLALRVKELLLREAPDLKPEDVEVTTSSVAGEDLKLSPAARLVYPFTFECKNQERIQIWDCLKQAQSYSDKRKDTYPLLIFSRNHSDDYVALKLEHFLKLVR